MTLLLVVPIGSVLLLFHSTTPVPRHAERANPPVEIETEGITPRQPPASASSTARRIVVSAPPREENAVKVQSEPVTAPGVEPRRVAVRLRFVGDGGAPLAPAEARRRFARGAVRLLPDALFSGGGVERRARVLLYPPAILHRDRPITWVEGAAFVHGTIQPGRYRLFVLRPRAAPMLSPAFEAGGREPPAVTIPLPAAPRGRRVRLVEEPTRQPVTGARVTPWFEYGDDRLFIPGRAVVPDASGEAFLPLLEEAVARGGRQPTWWAETETLAAEIAGDLLARTNTRDIREVVMQRRLRVVGEAWLANGLRATGCEVVCVRKGFLARSTVGPDGRFLLEGIPSESLPMIFLTTPPGEKTVGRDLILEVDRITGSAGATVEVVLGNPPHRGTSAAIAGRITAGGRALPGVLVVVKGKGGKRRLARTGEDGTYRIAGVAAGPAEVMAFLGDPSVIDDFRVRPRGGIRLAPGETRCWDVDLPAGVFHVAVVDADTGEPVPAALVTAHPENRERDHGCPGGTLSPGWGCLVNEEDIAVLPAGMIPGALHVVRVTAEGYKRVERRGQVPGSFGAPAKVTVKLER